MVSDVSAESFYHGLVLGMLSFMRDIYVITSNRESGYGRFDIMLKPRAEHRNFPAVIIEVKAAKDASEDIVREPRADDQLRMVLSAIEANGDAEAYKRSGRIRQWL